MTEEQFNQILENRIEMIRGTLTQKAKEYAIENTVFSKEKDRLYNFKRAGEIKQETPIKALWGMYAKHLVSVIDIFEGNAKVTHNLIDEKIGDSINYLILAEALLTEELSAEESDLD